MPLDGPGIYRHYKGGLYEVLGLGLREDSIIKPHDEHSEGFKKDAIGVTYVIYRPISEGSMLESRQEEYWLRELSDFNADVEDVAWKDASIPRFTKLLLSEIMATRNERLLEWYRNQI